MVHLEFLEEVTVFKDLNDDQLAVIQSYCQEAEFQRNDKIFSAGDDPLYLWVVHQGQVDLRWELAGRAAHAQKAITTLAPSATFGWSSLVPPYKYRLSAYCASRTCRLIRFARNDLVGLFEQDPAIGYRVMTGVLAVVGARFLNLQDEIARQRGSDIINRW
jgi:CRP-like cAMP-binding protein